MVISSNVINNLTNKSSSYRVIGLPGTGKTHKLMQMLREFLDNGYSMDGCSI